MLMIDRFLKELEDYYMSDTDILFVSRDLKNVLDCQKNRLKSKNLKIHYDFGYDETSNSFSNGQNAKYADKQISFGEYRKNCNLKYEIINDNKVIYNEKDNILIRAKIIDMKNDVDITRELSECPGCGNLDTVDNLFFSGCKYCGSHYQKKDLFPKVMGFYYHYFPVGSNKVFKRSIFIWTIILTLIGYFLAYGLKLFNFENSLFIIPVIAFAICEIFVVLKMVYKGIQGVKGFRKDSNELGPVKMDAKIDKLELLQFDFKAVTLLKLVLFSDFDDVPVYEGSNLKDKFSNLIDIKFRGLSRLVEMSTEGDYVYITNFVSLKNYYYENNEISIKNENLKVVYYKKKDVYNDFNFSLRRIECPCCGGTFDAYKSRKCSYCGEEVNLAELDWIIKSIEFVD